MSTKIEWVEAKLQEWARWRLAGGGGALGYAAVPLCGETLSGGGRDGYRESVIPTSDVDASETDDAIHTLPSELRATVECFYLGAGTQVEKLRRLCIAKQTMADRIGKAHRLLCAYFTDRQRAAQAERDRVEKLQCIAYHRQ